PSPGTEQEGRTRQRRVRPSAFFPGRSPCRRAAPCVFPAVISAGGHLSGAGARPGKPTGRALDAELFATEGTTIPDNATAGRLVMRDGVGIRYARFAATGRPLKGTVIIVTGRNEYIEKYFETIRDLSALGLGTLIFDLRGQGLSDRLIADPARGF